MEKKTIIKINDIKEFVVKDINRLKLDDIRKFIIKEFNTGEDFIYLYGNNSNKPIYSSSDLLNIKEEDYEHNLCLIKIRFKTRNNFNNNDNNNDNNYLSRTMALNSDQIKKAYYGIEKDTNKSNNVNQMRDSNKLNKYKNNFTNSGKNQNYNYSNNSNKFINNIKITSNKNINNNDIKSITNNNTNLINQKVNNNITSNTGFIYKNTNKTSNKNVNNEIYINKNFNNNMSNTNNKNVNNFITKTSNQSINNNSNKKINDNSKNNNLISKESNNNMTESDNNINNNSNKNINDINKNNNIISKESNNSISGSDNNINNTSNKNISNISNNSSNININGSSKKNSIKLSNKKMKKVNLNLNKKPNQESLEKKNFLKEISADIDEDKIYKEELEKYKEELQKEIETLEKELSDLKKENENIIQEGDNDEDIIINEKTMDKLKQVIINEVSSKIENDFKNQISEGLNKMNKINIKNHEQQINSKFEEIKEEYNKRIENEIKNLKLEQLNKINENKNNIMHNIDNNIADSSINRIKRSQIYNREKGQNNPNIKNVPENNLVQNINNKINYGNNNINYNKFLNLNKNNNNQNNIINDGQENIEDDDNNINNYGKINSFKKKNENPNMNRKTAYNNQGVGNILKEEPIKINDNSKKNPVIQKRKSEELNLLNILTNIFFTNPQQTEINTLKINEHHLEKIRKEYYKHINEERNSVYMFVNNFIKSNILRLFQKNNIPKEVLEIVKSKISSLLECINMRKDYYSAYYFPEMKKDTTKNRQSSVKAAERFRKEFNVSEQDINQKVLVDTLYENDNDIYQTFGLLYGK